MTGERLWHGVEGCFEVHQIFGLTPIMVRDGLSSQEMDRSEGAGAFPDRKRAELPSVAQRQVPMSAW